MENKKKVKVLVCSDIHGDHEQLSNAFDKFSTENYDKIVLLGDLADSYDRTNEDILRCFKIASDKKDLLEDRMIWLYGNHCWQYLFGRLMCSGFRPDLCISLNPFLNGIKDKLQIAYQIDNHLFTHAGVQRKWYNKYEKLINSFPGEDLAEQLNNMLNTLEGCIVLYEVGTKRGGMRYDYGGPMWCDRAEMESYGPLKGYHQYIGHIPNKYIEKIDKFEGGKHYNNTSVTFCDVLQKLPNTFLTLEI